MNEGCGAAGERATSDESAAGADRLTRTTNRDRDALFLPVREDVVSPLEYDTKIKVFQDNLISNVCRRACVVQRSRQRAR